MNPSAIKDEIIKLLEDIISRTNYISHHHPGKDLSLDIDLVKDDLRVLYRSFETLKNLAADRAPFSPKVETPGEEAEARPDYIETESALAPEEVDSLKINKEAEPAPATEAVEREAASEDTGIRSSITEESEKPKDDKADPAHAQEEKHIEPAVEERTKIHVAQSSQIEKEPQDKLEAEKEEKEETEETEETEPKVEKGSTQKVKSVSNGKQSVIDLLSAYSQKTIGDQYAAADNSLNKRISGDREDNSIGARMQLNPISNIKEVIGLNEKFLFINELFSGNIQEYHDAVARLNAMESMQSAFDFLNELSKKHSWDAERSTATINKLANYVQRRYM